MVAKELRWLAGEVELVARQRCAAVGPDAPLGAMIRRFREQVGLAEAAVTRGEPVAPAAESAIRDLAAVILDEAPRGPPPPPGAPRPR